MKNYESRNRAIARAAARGVRPVQLALDYDLSVDRIRRIVKEYKKKVEVKR